VIIETRGNIWGNVFGGYSSGTGNAVSNKIEIRCGNIRGGGDRSRM
jgi:hypothetical protein